MPWTIPITSSSRPHRDGIVGHSQAVLGTAINYSWPQIGVFVRSLRETAQFDGDILLWTAGWDEETQRKVDDYGIVTMRPTFQMTNPSHLDAIYARWTFYYDAIAHSLWDNLFITDVVDLVFQASPFDEFDGGLHVCTEDGLIGQEPINTSWIMTGWGARGLLRLWQRPISCVGTVWGGRLDLLGYIAKLTSNWAGLPIELRVEQGAHNWLVGAGEVDAQQHPNGDTVWTIGLNKDTDSYIEVDQGYLLRPKGQTKYPAAVHQYNRHPQLLNAIETHYGLANR